MGNELAWGWYLPQSKNNHENIKNVDSYWEAAVLFTPFRFDGVNDKNFEVGTSHIQHHFYLSRSFPGPRKHNICGLYLFGL